MLSPWWRLEPISPALPPFSSRRHRYCHPCPPSLFFLLSTEFSIFFLTFIRCPDCVSPSFLPRLCGGRRCGDVVKLPFSTLFFYLCFFGFSLSIVLFLLLRGRPYFFFTRRLLDDFPLGYHVSSRFEFLSFLRHYSRVVLFCTSSHASHFVCSGFFSPCSPSV